MTRSFLTVRVGATVTHVQCRDMAAMWITHLASAVVDPMSAGQAKSPTAMLTSPSPTPPSRRGGAQEDGPQQHGDEDEGNYPDAMLTTPPRNSMATPMPSPSPRTSRTSSSPPPGVHGGLNTSPKSGAPIPAAHLLGPGQVPKLPPPGHVAHGRGSSSRARRLPLVKRHVLVLMSMTRLRLRSCTSAW